MNLVKNLLFVKFLFMSGKVMGVFFTVPSMSFSKIVMVHQIDMYTLLKYRCCSFSNYTLT